jgi:hypothetical protein
MKKLNQMFVVVTGLLMFGLFCAPVHSTPFDGTWFHDRPEANMLKITFTDNSFSYVWESGNVNGQFTYERNRIEFQASDGSKWSTTYRINKDVLTLNKGTGCWHESGDFNKSAVDEYQNIAPNSVPTVFEGAWIHSADNTGNSIITFTGNTFAYTWYWGGTNGRIIFDNRNVTLITDDGRKWTTPYSVNRDQTQLSLNNGKGAWWWYGRFNKLSLREYQNIAPNSAPTAFEGTWKHPKPQAQNGAITFSGNSFSYTSDNGRRNGRFTNTDKMITFFADNGSKWTAPYTLIDGYCLFLEEGTGSWWWWGWGAFLASPLSAPDSTPTAFEGTWKQLNYTFTFTGNSFTATNNTESGKGRFIFDNKNITLIYDNGLKDMSPYTVNQTRLSIFGATFNKQ